MGRAEREPWDLVVDGMFVESVDRKPVGEVVDTNIQEGRFYVEDHESLQQWSFRYGVIDHIDDGVIVLMITALELRTTDFYDVGS